jgi:hypothetical protein
VVQTVPAAALSSGEYSMTVGTQRSSFFRYEVLDPSGRVVAFSNPVWHLAEAPRTPLPARRRAPDSV